jgi:hypothetical protein
MMDWTDTPIALLSGICHLFATSTNLGMSSSFCAGIRLLTVGPGCP